MMDYSKINLPSKAVMIRMKAIDNVLDSGIVIPDYGATKVSSLSGIVLAVANDINSVTVGQKVIIKGPNRWLNKILNDDIDGAVEMYQKARQGSRYHLDLLNLIAFENDSRPTKVSDDIVIVLEKDVIAYVR